MSLNILKGDNFSSRGHNKTGKFLTGRYHFQVRSSLEKRNSPSPNSYQGRQVHWIDFTSEIAYHSCFSLWHFYISSLTMHLEEGGCYIYAEIT